MAGLSISLVLYLVEVLLRKRSLRLVMLLIGLVPYFQVPLLKRSGSVQTSPVLR